MSIEDTNTSINTLAEALRERTRGIGLVYTRILVEFMVGNPKKGFNVAFGSEEKMDMLTSLHSFLHHPDTDPKTTILPKLKKIAEEHPDEIPRGDFEGAGGEMRHNSTLLEIAFEELNDMWENPQI